MDYIASHGLDIFTTVLGLVYILLEYRASIWLWLVGIIMPALDVWPTLGHGLYGDAGMAVYYTIAGIYGYAVWKYGKKHNQRKKNFRLPIWRNRSISLLFCSSWQPGYHLLYTDNFHQPTVPLQDSFTNALSFVGLWALAMQIYRAVVLLDYRRCRLLLSLYRQRYPIQGRDFTVSTSSSP